MSKLEDDAKLGHVEHREVVNDQLGTLQEPVSDITGTVKLAEESDTYLIPAPSADPRGLIAQPACCPPCLIKPDHVEKQIR